MTTTPEQLSDEEWFAGFADRQRIEFRLSPLSPREGKPITSHAVNACDLSGVLCGERDWCTSQPSDGYEPKHSVTA